MDRLALRRLVIVAIPALILVGAAVAVAFMLSSSSTETPATSSDPLNGPHIGDHWHAAYTIFIGNTRQPNIPTFTGPEETHTHGDGIIHIHPFIPAGEK